MLMGLASPGAVHGCRNSYAYWTSSRAPRLGARAWAKMSSPRRGARAPSFKRLRITIALHSTAADEMLQTIQLDAASRLQMI